MNKKNIIIEYIDKAPVDLRLINTDIKLDNLREQLVNLLGEEQFKKLSEPLTKEELDALAAKYDVSLDLLNRANTSQQVGAMAESKESPSFTDALINSFADSDK